MTKQSSQKKYLKYALLILVIKGMQNKIVRYDWGVQHSGGSASGGKHDLPEWWPDRMLKIHKICIHVDPEFHV